MSTLRVIVVAEAGYRTPAPAEVLVVLVGQRTDAWPKIEAQRAEGGVTERASEVRVGELQSCEDRLAERREDRRIILEGLCWTVS